MFKRLAFFVTFLQFGFSAAKTPELGDKMLEHIQKGMRQESDTKYLSLSVQVADLRTRISKL